MTGDEFEVEWFVPHDLTMPDDYDGTDMVQFDSCIDGDIFRIRRVTA